jgi:hypothetical protein
MVINGVAYWAAVNVPNTTFEPVWTITLEVDAATSTQLQEAGLKPKMVEGKARYTIKRKTHKKDGSSNRKPVLLDKDGNSTDVLIGNGSVVAVQCDIQPWKYMNKSGIRADLQGVKIIELVEYNNKPADGSELGMVSPAEVSEDELFSE